MGLSSSAVQIKVCGVTQVTDAERCLGLGVGFIGLNFWPQSPRRVELAQAQRIAQRLDGRVKLVGVFVDAEPDEIRAIRSSVPLDLVQLHGDEPPEVVNALGPGAFKALRVGTESIEIECGRYPGEYLLLDARVPGQPDGTDH